MSKQRLLEIAAALNDLSWSLNDGAVGRYAEEIQGIVESMPEEPSPDDVCGDCGLKRSTHPVECCPDGFS